MGNVTMALLYGFGIHLMLMVCFHFLRAQLDFGEENAPVSQELQPKPS
jgi:hypothetical protein